MRRPVDEAIAALNEIRFNIINNPSAELVLTVSLLTLHEYSCPL